ncbi:MAG TPA: ferredoxin [candidate division Zixibacteria bacterium]|nr:ferredoxin [candidate division Zixibacteria bacterium]
MPVEINYQLCGLCYGCATICPECLYYYEDEKLKIQDGCTDCGSCLKCCPVKAISEI